MHDFAKKEQFCRFEPFLKIAWWPFRAAKLKNSNRNISADIAQRWFMVAEEGYQNVSLGS